MNAPVYGYVNTAQIVNGLVGYLLVLATLAATAWVRRRYGE